MRGRTAVLFFVLFVSTAWAASTVPVAWAADTPIAPSATEPSQMQDFNLAGYGAEGQKTWEVEGASMEMSGPEIKIRDITARMYGAQENLVVTADHGNFDKETGVVRLTQNVKAVTDGGVELNTTVLDWSQKTQQISSDEKVDITKENLKAEGIGMEAHPDSKVATFEKDVVVTLEDKKPLPPDAAATSENAVQQPFGGKGGRLVITCDGPMELNYDKQVATFYKNVHVVSEGDSSEMIADKMTVRFSQAARQIETIVAEGNVQIIRGENISYSDGAVFDNTTRKVTLTGRPKLVIFTDDIGSGMPGLGSEKAGGDVSS